MFFALLVMADLAAATPSPTPSTLPAAVTTASSPSPAIAYDQIDRFYQALAVPEPGGFADLEAKLLTNDVSDDSYPPPAASATSTFANGNFTSRAQRMQAGLVQRFLFLGALSRVDDLNTKRATINRPDRGQIIYLDLVSRTYRIVAGNAAQAILQPPDPAAMLRQIQALMPSSQQTGSERIESSKSPSTPLGPRQIDGITADGYRMTQSTTGESRTGTCPPVHASVSFTEYVDPTRIEPAKSARALESYSGMNNVAGMTVLGCKFMAPVTQSLPPAPPSWLNDFFIYRRADIESDTAFGTINLTYLSERGNVHALTPADASSFDIPPGFVPAPAASAPAASATSGTTALPASSSIP
jgi:hypothetical protein